MFSGAKFDFLADRLPGQIDNEDEENQEPQMTQLDYEDPDATAMRAEFLRNAGKLVGNPRKADSDVLHGEVRELEDIGWGHGRRTRKQVPKPDGE
jgi:DNA replication regulator DPB11